jgi:hypothetical protein
MFRRVAGNVVFVANLQAHDPASEWKESERSVGRQQAMGVKGMVWYQLPFSKMVELSADSAAVVREHGWVPPQDRQV